MDEVHDRNLQRLVEQMSHVDELTLVVLKGHLILEEQLERILGTFVFHVDYLDDAKMGFAQKVAVARSVSLDEHANPMWDLVLAINSLRNELAHALDSEKRRQRLDRVKSLYFSIYGEHTVGDQQRPDHEVVTFAVTLALGFLGSFEKEVARFKTWVTALDLVVNPHRHKEAKETDSPSRGR